MDNELFRRHGHEFVDWLADYLDNVGTLPVMSRVKPGEIRAQIPSAPPERSEPMDRIFEDFKTIILPGITHWQHPAWHAYFPANNSPASVLAELLTAGLGAQGMIWQTSPAAAELEDARPRVAAPDARPSRGPDRRHPGHGLDGHALRPAFGPGEGHGFRGQREGT